MTYAAQDNSVHDGEPVEFFKFVSPNKTYRYNDGDAPLYLAGELYEPLAITRGAIEVGVSLAGASTVDIEIPFDSELAVEQGYLLTPDYLEVTIYRGHRGSDLTSDYSTIWQARARGFSIKGLLLTIQTIPALVMSFEVPMLNVYYQVLCNHRLYDERCKVNKSLHTTTATVTVVGGAAVTVDDDGVGDSELKAGEIRNVRTGERRMIVDNLVNVIDLSFGFTDIEVGDTVTLSKGCLHNYAACLGFNNTDNYGGFRFIPRNNPLGQTASESDV
jgi:hypothetical protein